MRKRTLKEALEALQELDFMAGPGAGADGQGMPTRPDTSGVRMRGRKDNFTPIRDRGDEYPYDDYGEAGPANAQGDGPSGVGRGGVGWGGRPDRSGGVRAPSGVYDMTWQQEVNHPDGEHLMHSTHEGADWEESQRHGDDKYRNVWRDTPDGQEWTELNNEAMGTPSIQGPTLTPMDGPQHAILNFSDEDEDDMLPKNNPNGPGNMWGGPSTIPGQSRGWSASPSFDDHPEDPWKVPEDKPMKLREFFDPNPIPVEEIDNPEQDHFEDQGDDELQPDPDHGPGIDEPDTTTEPETIAVGIGDFMMGPNQVGMARGRYGLQTDAPGPHGEIVDKSSAWDVLQKVVDALSSGGGKIPGGPGGEL